MNHLIWGRGSCRTAVMKFLGRFQGVCVAGVGRGRQVEAVKYKKGQANYREANLTRNPREQRGTVRCSFLAMFSLFQIVLDSC